MISQYARYIKERQNIDAIESEIGFVHFRVVGEECFIVDMFVEPEFRGKSKGRKILNDLKCAAIEKGASVITANIHLKITGANETLLAAQACGFEVTSAQNDILLISKVIKEDSHG
jgi:GNAT superfamily N-acetyltransferase